ncbi:MAG: MYXO-CTERM sorting domain-containing protein [Myxococcota bacterium]|nr:MYXO-CTERM sorting domain-containing protein [Myxococcota bacterium]
MTALAIGLVSPNASGNGRFPRAERLLEDPANPDRVLLAATYGLLTTHDRGKTWYHTCEGVFAGLDSYNGDPILDLVAGGASLVDVQYEINRSTDDCAWTPVLDTNVPVVGHELIHDFSVERAQRKIVVALVESDIGATTTFHLKESSDGGMTWAVLGVALPLSVALTVDLDPSDPTHLYASGLAPDGTPALVTSADHAATWTSRLITGVGQGELPYIAAVRAGVAGSLFVRTDSTVVVSDGEGGSVGVGGDALLYTSDGGMTWTQVLRKSAKLLGFALSPDGTAVLAGYGNDDTARLADTSQLGVFRASTSDWQFLPVYPGHPVTCITWTAAGTYVCTGIQTPPVVAPVVFFPTGTLGVDPPSPAPFFGFHDVAGPSPFCASTRATCDWTGFCALFDACDAGGAARNANATVDDAPPDDAPLGPAGDATVADSSAVDPHPAGSAASSNCSCRPGPPPTTGGAAAIALLALVFVVRRRRHTAGDRGN